MKIYALDIGGSSIKHSPATIENGKVTLPDVKNVTKLKNNTTENLINAMLGILVSYCGQHPDLDTVAVSTTGVVNLDEIVEFGVFENYRGTNWAKIIKNRLPQIKKVKVVNDGRAAALAEFKARGGTSVAHAHLAVGTGIGGGIVYGGKLLAGKNGQAGYLGHVKVGVNEDTYNCRCGSTGCVETMASSQAISLKYEEISGESLSVGGVIKRADAGDEQALQALKFGAYNLGLGIGNTMNVINPEIITIGGGVTAAMEKLYSGKEFYLKHIIEGAKRTAHPEIFKGTIITKGILDNSASLIGAAYLVAEDN